jgi:galactonate dehydratase
MKITNIECIPVQAPGRTLVPVLVETDEGISGIGEAGLQRRWRAIEGAIEHVKRWLIGQDPMRIEYLWQRLYRGGFYPADRLIGSVIAGIDIARWDVKGKKLGVPVYELLGGKVRDRVVLYPHNRAGQAENQVDALVESCLETTRAGWKFVRWGLPTQEEGVLEPSTSIRTCVEQIKAVRAAVGDEIGICIDVHTRLDQADTIQLLRAVEPYRPFFMEDPIRAENFASLRRVRQATAVPIAMGEHCSSKWEFREMIEEELVDYVRLDVAMCGGLSEARKIAGWAELHYLKIAPHNPLGVVSTASALHLCLATDNFGVLECPRRPGTNMTDAFPVQVEWEDGYLLPPRRPGLGVEVDRQVLKEKYPFRLVELPTLRRLDGSLTNW